MSNRAVCRHIAESHTLNIPYMHLVALEGMPRLSLRTRAHVLARAPVNAHYMNVHGHEAWHVPLVTHALPVSGLFITVYY